MPLKPFYSTAAFAYLNPGLLQEGPHAEGDHVEVSARRGENGQLLRRVLREELEGRQELTCRDHQGLFT